MAGRKEILTEDLAKRIAKMISQMPDSSVPVTWENVMAQAKRKFGHGFNRQMLSQKEWNGRKIIAEAFSEAKSVQSRMQRESAPKYQTAPRALLQKRIADLEAKVLGLREELETVRAHQYEKLDVFLNTPNDLRSLVERAASQPRSTAPKVADLKAERMSIRQADDEADL
jgi:hypothetical protein